jgi:predicted membrane channel-forming protein YqfA (hemolysin III family)
MQLYVYCAASCFFLSSIYHLYGCVSENYHKSLLRVDLSGIAALVAGSYFIGAYYGSSSLPFCYHFDNR